MEASLELYQKLVELERLAAAAKNVAADRVAECSAWWLTPYRSPAHYMAACEARPVNRSTTRHWKVVLLEVNPHAGEWVPVEPSC